MDLGASARLVTGAGRTQGYSPLVGDEVPPGGSAVLALIQGQVYPAEYACPFPAAVATLNAAAGEGRGPANAFRLVSSEPVAATYFWPYGSFYGSETVSAAALRSAESWSADYLDVGAFRPGRPPPSDGFVDTIPAFTGLLARENTHVTLTRDGGLETLALEGGTVRLEPQDDLFIGTKLSADHPFGLFTGSEYLRIPFDVKPENRVLQAVSPPGAWASEYAAVKFPDRREADPAIWRFVAQENGTTLTYEPNIPAGAPTVMNAGDLADFSTQESFVVRSQDAAHSFHASQIMPSGFTICELDDAGLALHAANCHSAYPELLATVPLAEFAQSFAFVTDPYFPDTSLTVIRHADNEGFHDVVLDCAGVLTGWQALGLPGRYEYARIPLSAGSFEPQSYPSGACDNGAHTMGSDGLFTVAVWAGQHPAALPPDVDDVSFSSNYAFNVYGRRREVEAGTTK